MAACLVTITTAAAQLERIPDKPVVLTFDDSNASHYTVVRPAIALRDLAGYVDWRQKPADPWKIIEERKIQLAR